MSYNHKIVHQMVPLAIVPNLATTCIGCKFGHQMAPLALPQSLAIELVSSPARVTSVKFQQGQLETLGTQVYLGPIKMSSEMEVALPP